MEDIVGERLAERCPAKFRRPESGLVDLGGAGPRLLRRPAEKHRGIWQLRISVGVTQKLVSRNAALAAEQIARRGLDTRPSMGGLKQIHAVVSDGRRHAGDVVRSIQPLAERGGGNWPTGPMRHRSHKSGDRGQRRGLAFALALMAA